MTRGDLGRMTFLGRPIKPLAFAIMMSVATIFWFNVVANTDVLYDSLAGDIVGVTAGASTAMLMGAWWFRSQRFVEYGLLLAAGVWISRLLTVIFIQGLDFYGVYLSFAWTIATVSAYLLETWDTQKQRA